MLQEPVPGVHGFRRRRQAGEMLPAIAGLSPFTTESPLPGRAIT